MIESRNGKGEKNKQQNVILQRRSLNILTPCEIGLGIRPFNAKLQFPAAAIIN
jgi:hypothetical protein